MFLNVKYIKLRIKSANFAPALAFLKQWCENACETSGILSSGKFGKKGKPERAAAFGMASTDQERKALAKLHHDELVHPWHPVQNLYSP